MIGKVSEEKMAGFGEKTASQRTELVSPASVSYSPS